MTCKKSKHICICSRKVNNENYTAVRLIIHVTYTTDFTTHKPIVHIKSYYWMQSCQS